MNLSNNEVLVTGGGSGIGFSLATKFLNAGSRVVICGRRKDVLESAKRANPGFETFPYDLSKEAERVRLAQWIASSHPRLNVLVKHGEERGRLPNERK